MEEASMSDRLPEEQNPIVQNANIHVTITYTRRTLLAGAAAATAAATVGTVITTMPARAADPISTEDLSAFVTLSAALTGIQDKQLAPGFDRAPPGSDSIDIKRDYFRWVKEKRSVAFEKLLGIAKGNPKPAAQAIIEQVQADPESKYLARSIVLMWYLPRRHRRSLTRSFRRRRIPRAGCGGSRRHIRWARATCNLAIGNASPIRNVLTSSEARNGRRM